MRRRLFGEESGVDCWEVLELCGHVEIKEDRSTGTQGLAGAALVTLIGIYIILIVFHTVCRILAVGNRLVRATRGADVILFARIYNYVCHHCNLSCRTSAGMHEIPHWRLASHPIFGGLLR